MSDILKLLGDVLSRLETLELRVGQLENGDKQHFIPPTAELVMSVMWMEGKTIDANAFISHYESQGWKKSNGLAITDWKAAARSWHVRQQKDPKFNGGKSRQTKREWDASVRRSREQIESRLRE